MPLRTLLTIKYLFKINFFFEFRLFSKREGGKGEGEWRSQPFFLKRNGTELFKDCFYNFIFAHNFPVLCLKFKIQTPPATIFPKANTGISNMRELTTQPIMFVVYTSGLSGQFLQKISPIFLSH